MKQINFDFLMEFYQSEPARRISHEISCRLRKTLLNKKVLAFGFCGDFLDTFETNELYYAVPNSYETFHCPSVSPLKTIVVDESAMPFASNAWDAIIVIHHIEFSNRNQDFLNELFRILKSDGQLIVVSMNKSRADIFCKNNRFVRNIKLSLKDIISSLMIASFNIRNIFGVNQKFNFWPYNFSYKLNKYNEILINFFPFLSDVVVMVANKSDLVPELIIPLEKQYGMT